MGEGSKTEMQNRKTFNTTSEDEVKSNTPEKSCSKIAGGLERKSHRDNSQSDKSHDEVSSDLQDKETFPEYVDTNFTKQEFLPLIENEDKKFIKTGSIDLPVKAFEFFKLCLADDADCSMTVFMRDSYKDSTVEYGAWCKDDRDRGQPLTFRRDVSIQLKIPFPVPIPFFPKAICTSDKQRFRFFGPHCVVINQLIKAPKAPYGDTVHVIIKWKVVDKANSGRCQITIDHSFLWLKSSFLKKLIQGLISKGIKDWFSKWTKWLKEMLDKREVKSETTIDGKRLRDDSEESKAQNPKKKRRLD